MPIYEVVLLLGAQCYEVGADNPDQAVEKAIELFNIDLVEKYPDCEVREID